MLIIKKVLKYCGIGLLVVLGLVIIIVIDVNIKLKYTDSPPLPSDITSQNFITANPVNLGQLAGISKFRSCQGHDYPGKGDNGKVEFKSSMKHYLAPRDDLREQLGVIEIFAPFDGTVVLVFNEKWGDQLTLTPAHDDTWGLVLFHVDRVAGIKSGTDVKAGQLLGYANVKGRHDFDIALTRTTESLIVEKVAKALVGHAQLPLPRSHYLVSAFDYMTDDVLAEFKDAGFNTDDLKYTQEYRAENPCNFDNAAYLEGDWDYLPGHGPMDKSGNQKFPPPATDLEQPFMSPPAMLHPN